MIHSILARFSRRTFVTSLVLILAAEIATIFIASRLLDLNTHQWIRDKTAQAMRTSEQAARTSDWSLIDKIPKDRSSSLFEKYRKKLDDLSQRRFRRKEGAIYLVIVEQGEAYEIAPATSEMMDDVGKANQPELLAYTLRKPSSTAIPISDDFGTYLAAYTPITKDAKVIGLVAAEYDSATLADFQGIVQRAFWFSMLPGALVSLVISGALASKFVEPVEVLRDIDDLRKQGLAESDGGKAPWGLTERETDVFESLADGLTNAQIAARLFMSTETVKSHLKSIFRKSQLDRYHLGLVAHERRGKTGRVADRA